MFECVEQTVDYANVGTITWLAADEDAVAYMACPHGGGDATRACLQNTWQTANLSSCDSAVSGEITGLVKQLEGQDSEAITSALGSLITDNIRQFGPKDIQKVIMVLEDTDVTDAKVCVQE